VRTNRLRAPLGLALALAGSLALLGCYNTPVDFSAPLHSPAPLRTPPPAPGEDCCYEDSITGGHVFEMYCAACHNARSLAERPFSNYQNAAQHMRVRANLTGEEYAKLMEFLRRWHDVPPPNRPVEPSPKKLIFSQPMNELREKKPAEGEAPRPPSGEGEQAANEAQEGPGQ
jgi:hypothetical protein